MKPIVFVCIFFALVSFVLSDTYLHNFRGSNDRYNEASNARTNANRLFDSQNNERGGYNVGDSGTKAGEGTGQGIMKYIGGSWVHLEWTNQHGCGAPNSKVSCELVLQYMCEQTGTNSNVFNPNSNSGQIRDGTTTGTIDPNNPDAAANGRHEPGAWYQSCKTRTRNYGLFVADQNLQGTTAIYTRQNPNGDRYGLECAEERDYYPYWHPTPWIDIAVFTSNTSLCDYYQSASNNVQEYGYCSNVTSNNADTCTQYGGDWKTYTNSKPKPECLAAQWTRDNHLGNTPTGEMFSYDWQLPDTTASTCVFRLRYNISTADYWGHDSAGVFADSVYNKTNPLIINGYTPFEDDPVVDFGIKHGVNLTVDTAQLSRTFQDRSHVFSIVDKSDIDNPNKCSCDNIYNLNIRGKRGNIVQVFPAVEYDFVPTDFNMSTGDCVHIQWTGSLTNDNGNDGQGTAGTDKNNMVQIANRKLNHPMAFDNVTMWSSIQDAERFASVGLQSGEMDPELNDRPAYYNGGLYCFDKKGVYHYMCSRNNNFSNRSQKGSIYVTKD